MLCMDYEMMSFRAQLERGMRAERALMELAQIDFLAEIVTRDGAYMHSSIAEIDPLGEYAEMLNASIGMQMKYQQEMASAGH